MFEHSASVETPDYQLLVEQVRSILDGESDLASNAAQFSALVYQSMSDLNWAGFYFLRPARLSASAGRSHELLVGPYQGKVACARIPVGRGVCGTVAAHGKTLVVPDVHAFPGHIACDSASNSEIVIPVIKDGQLMGVFDIDSPKLNRFAEVHQLGLENMVRTFAAVTDFSELALEGVRL